LNQPSSNLKNLYKIFSYTFVGFGSKGRKFGSTFPKGRKFGSTFSKVDKVENNIL